MKLDLYDLKWAIQRTPKKLLDTMKSNAWHSRLFVGGGFLRSIVTNEKVNDIDVFVSSERDAELLSRELADKPTDIHKTDNAYTIKGFTTIQIIHRWVFDKIEDVSNSFDFTCCCAVFSYNGKEFESYCDERFYMDNAAKRLVYRFPVRNEDAGGSMLRVLKYYQKGYRIPLDSLGGVIARLVKGIDPIKLRDEDSVAKVVTGLLREVDPNIDPLHQSHLPSNIQA